MPLTTRVIPLQCFFNLNSILRAFSISLSYLTYSLKIYKAALRQSVFKKSAMKIIPYSIHPAVLYLWFGSLSLLSHVVSVFFFINCQRLPPANPYTWNSNKSLSIISQSPTLYSGLPLFPWINKTLHLFHMKIQHLSALIYTVHRGA